MATSAIGFDNFFSTTLSTAITDSDTTIALVTTPTATEGYLVIEPDSSTNREIIYYTGVSGGSVTLPSVGAGRGVGGTSARAHSSGVVVKMNTVAEMFEALKDGTGLSTGFVLPTGVVTSENLNATIACRAYRNAALNITSSGVKVTFDTENYDLGSDFDATTGTFTAPVTGYYSVTSSIGVSNLDAGGQIYVEIYVNGSLYSRGTRIYAVSATDDPQSIVSDVVPVTAGQTIEIYATSSTTEAIQTGTNSAYVAIYFIGA